MMQKTWRTKVYDKKSRALWFYGKRPAELCSIVS